MTTTHTFRAMWPVTDESLGLAELADLARTDLPLLVAQARATISGPGRFTLADSAQVPGSGRVTRYVLVYEAPAVHRPPCTTPLTTRRARAVWARGESGECDPLVVEAVLAGEWSMPTTVEEKREVCRRWHAAGRPLPLLAEFTGWKVERYFKARKEVAA